jgi:hypothetical protein
MNSLITQFGEGLALSVVAVASYLAATAGIKHFENKKIDRELSTSRILPSSKPVSDKPALTVPPPPTQSNSGFIFVSYKREDFPRITPFLHKMVKSGYEVWYDRGIPGGAEWDALIEEKVSHCEVLIVFLSDAAVDSKWVRREIKFADSENRPILGIRLDKNVQLKHGLKVVMNQYQMIDASNEDFSDELRKAIEYVRLL